MSDSGIVLELDIVCGGIRVEARLVFAPGPVRAEDGGEVERIPDEGDGEVGLDGVDGVMAVIVCNYIGGIMGGQAIGDTKVFILELEDGSIGIGVVIGIGAVHNDFSFIVLGSREGITPFYSPWFVYLLIALVFIAFVFRLIEIAVLSVFVEGVDDIGGIEVIVVDQVVEGVEVFIVDQVTPSSSHV